MLSRISLILSVHDRHYQVQCLKCCLHNYKNIPIKVTLKIDLLFPRINELFSTYKINYALGYVDI